MGSFLVLVSLQKDWNRDPQLMLKQGISIKMRMPFKGEQARAGILEQLEDWDVLS